MKRSLVFGALLAFLFLAAVTSHAAVYTYQPTPANMSDFDHYAAYTWGLEWENPNEKIIGAELTFKNIYDWRVEEDFLYIHLMDLTNPDLGVTRYDDNGDGDYFDGQGELIGVYSDPFGGGPGVDVTFSFTDAQLASLNNFASDGYYEFGFDPDCHYFNEGVELTLTTAVPEPTTMMLLGLGIVGLGLRRKLRK